MVLIFHVPLFSKWLREVQGKGVRVQMIIDAPDDLYQLQSPPGLKEAVLHAQSLYEKTKEVRVTSKAGTDLTYRCGEYPVMSQYGMADEPGRFDHWGVGLLHTFPNEGSAHGKVVFAPGDIVILPYCRYVRRSGPPRDPRGPHHQHRRRPRRDADARLARRRQDQRARTATPTPCRTSAGA